jgi:transcriptional regulator with XRE-family HTH domain
MTFSEWMMENRKRLDWSQTALGEKLGYKQNVVSLLEKGSRKPDAEVVSLLETLYGQPAPSLDLSEPRPKRKHTKSEKRVQVKEKVEEAVEDTWLTTVLLSVKHLATFYAHLVRGISQDNGQPLLHQDAVESVKYDCATVTAQLNVYPIRQLETSEGVYRLRSYNNSYPQSVPCWELEFPSGDILSLQTSSDNTLTEIVFFQAGHCTFALLTSTK